MHRRVVTLCIALLVAPLLGCAARTAEKLPGAVASLPSERMGALRVMTFNVQSCKQGLERIAATILAANPDVVALQEVDNGTSRSSGVDQARELARLTGMPFSAHIPATQMHGGDYGMALLSRLPVKSLKQRQLPVAHGMEPRVVSHAVILLDGAEISLYKAHLSPMPQRSALRREQAAYLRRLIAADRRPRILVGDLNDVASSSAVRLLTAGMQDSWIVAGSGSAGTYPLPLLGTFRFDYVLTSDEFAVARAFVMEGDASDHYPVVADLELTPMHRAVANSDEQLK